MSHLKIWVYLVFPPLTKIQFGENRVYQASTLVVLWGTLQYSTSKTSKCSLGGTIANTGSQWNTTNIVALSRWAVRPPFKQKSQGTKISSTKSWCCRGQTGLQLVFICIYFPKILIHTTNVCRNGFYTSKRRNILIFHSFRWKEYADEKITGK